MVALIPARAGSKRCPGKNTRLLNGHPLIAYTIAAAQQSGVFEDVVVCSDSEIAIADGRFRGARIVRREAVSDGQPDIAWVRETFVQIGRSYAFAILRPTSPFRTADTIRRAYYEFRQMADCGDSIRAVEPCPVNVYKCWAWSGAGMPMRPLVNGVTDAGVPLHSAPSQLAPVVWLQNSSLEMAYTANVEVHGSIAGKKIGPFFTHGMEGFSIDTEEDFARAERIAAEHPEWLPRIDVATGVSETRA